MNLDMQTCRHVFFDMKTCRHVFFDMKTCRHVFFDMKTCRHDSFDMKTCLLVFLSKTCLPVFLSKFPVFMSINEESGCGVLLGNVASAFVFLFMLLSFVSLLMPQRPVCGTEWQCEAAAARGAGSYRSSAHTSGCCR